MARILIVSSWVAEGHVGLSAAAPALQALGHGVTGLPTVILSNHPGWPHVSGAPVSVDQLEGMRAALAANGWLSGLDAVLTGYMPTPAHVDWTAGLVRGLGAGRVVVDPILGDAPGGLYVPETVATAIRDRLLPLADIATPNAFELGWLTGREVTDPATARHAARDLGPAVVHVTSAPARPGRTGILTVTPAGVEARSTPRRAGVPHGVGDVFAGLVAGGLCPGAVLGHLDALIAESLGAAHLRLAETAAIWRHAGAIQTEEAPHGL